jgi:hypothetical protein
LKVKGSAAPLATAIFRTSLNFALFPDQDWHWAIVKAKGIPPQAPLDAPTIMQPGEAATAPAPAQPDASTKAATPPAQSPSNNIPVAPEISPR